MVSQFQDMLMDYSDCLAYIESLSPTLEKPSLTRIAAFMACHGNLQNQYEVIHVGGTNGKGSTVALIDSIARAAKLKVGRFTGPHLLRWNERFHIDGKPISDADFARIGSHVRQLSQSFGEDNPDIGPLTWFEFLTAIAFFWFAESNVDLAVIEVGLGGRFDATNIVENVLVSVITNIDLDHTHILGNSVEEIAFEKSGIIKAGVPVVTGAVGAALGVIRERSNQLGCQLFAVAENLNGALGQKVQRDFDLCKSSLALVGSYQQTNGLLAVAAFHISGLAERVKQNSAEIVRHGFESAYWPGRLQLTSDERVILDGAHNAAGALALRVALDRLHPNSKFQFVIGCFENKNARQIVDALIRSGDRVYASQAATRRATYDKEQLAAFCTERGATATTFDSIADAFSAARHESDRFVVVTGSFATVKEVMIALGWKSVEDGSPECVKILDVQSS
ncbi:MAG: bifunctional folylpolyglutamate synthase/dihydrofolate synthase [Cyanobacteria bacterium SZAS-4]|nr:bifunctional folylpolyglutamate synthase/dihydrofolate synthase [Cyanobacteria bacterium SZAS-4]